MTAPFPYPIQLAASDILNVKYYTMSKYCGSLNIERVSPFIQRVNKHVCICEKKFSATELFYFHLFIYLFIFSSSYSFPVNPVGTTFTIPKILLLDITLPRFYDAFWLSIRSYWVKHSKVKLPQKRDILGAIVSDLINPSNFGGSGGISCNCASGT